MKTNQHTEETIILESVSSPIPSTHRTLRSVQERNGINASLTSESDTFTDDVKIKCEMKSVNLSKAA